MAHTPSAPLPTRPQFYGLFKQAKEGDNTKPKPGMMDFAGKAKWGAWNDVKGLDADEAKSQYVEYFIQVLDKAGNPEAAKIKEQVRPFLLALSPFRVARTWPDALQAAGVTTRLCLVCIFTAADP